MRLYIIVELLSWVSPCSLFVFSSPSLSCPHLHSYSHRHSLISFAPSPLFPSSTLLGPDCLLSVRSRGFVIPSENPDGSPLCSALWSRCAVVACHSFLPIGPTSLQRSARILDATKPFTLVWTIPPRRHFLACTPISPIPCLLGSQRSIHPRSWSDVAALRSLSPVFWAGLDDFPARRLGYSSACMVLCPVSMGQEAIVGVGKLGIAANVC